MKAAKADLARALERPDSAIRLYLLHGADEAASRDIAGRLAAKLVDPDDAMARVDIEAKSLSSDPGRLADEAAAVSMFGGARLIRVEGAGDEAEEAVRLLLEAPAAGNPAVMTAGALRKGSKLLALAEGSPLAFCFVSYAPDARDLVGFVNEAAAEVGLRPSRDAAAVLADSCAGDRGILRQELEKLALYLNASVESPQPLERRHLTAVGATLDDADFSGLVEAVASGQPADADRQIAQLEGQGIAGIALSRAVARRLWLLAELRDAVDGGMSPDAAIGGLRPPLFWKEKPAVTAQIGRWRAPALRAALARLLEAERAAKRGGSAGDVLSSQALLGIAVQAQR